MSLDCREEWKQIELGVGVMLSDEGLYWKKLQWHPLYQLYSSPPRASRSLIVCAEHVLFSWLIDESPISCTE
jgi:hypothetical protein